MNILKDLTAIVDVAVNMLDSRIINDKRNDEKPTDGTLLTKTVVFNQSEYKISLGIIDELTAIKTFITKDIKEDINLYSITPITGYYESSFDYMIEATIEYTVAKKEFKDGNLVKHVKSGGFYRVLSNNVLNEADKTKMVVYLSLQDGVIWVRPSSEFNDGRFVLAMSL